MKRNQSPAQTIRFRRWSRKSYAAFASIGRCVTIGCLRKNVADSSLRKQDTVRTIPYSIHTMTIDELKARVLAGIDISPDQAAWLANTADREALYAAAHEITVQCSQHEFDMCSIINAKSGRCPENCKWCAQSAHHHTQIETYDAIPIHEAISIARLNEQQGIKRLSLVTSGRRIKASEIDYFCDIYRKMGEETHLHLCASMGLLKREELEKLKAAGVKRYHCNLETASSYFSELCTTHTIEQKKETIRTAQKLGMEICSGGIIGMGENMKQRIELAFELKELGVCSVPMNILNPIPGTPLEHMPPISDEEILVTIAIFRFILPRTFIRFAGGRARLSRETQKQALSAGVNGLLTVSYTHLTLPTKRIV